MALTIADVLNELDHVTCVRVAVGCTGLALPVWVSAHPDDDRPAASIDAARVWLECPCDDHIDAAYAAAAAANAAADAAGDYAAAAAAYAAANAAYGAAYGAANAAYAATYAAAASAAAYAAAYGTGAASVWMVVLAHATPLTGPALDLAATLAADVTVDIDSLEELIETVELVEGVS